MSVTSFLARLNLEKQHAILRAEYDRLLKVVKFIYEEHGLPIPSEIKARGFGTFSLKGAFKELPAAPPPMSGAEAREAMLNEASRATDKSRADEGLPSVQSFASIQIEKMNEQRRLAEQNARRVQQHRAAASDKVGRTWRRRTTWQSGLRDIADDIVRHAKGLWQSRRRFV